jgi:segregation and condensation protein B
VNSNEEAEENPISPNEARSAIKQAEMAMEAILFAAGHPVSYEKLAAVIGLTERDMRNLAAQMEDGFENRGIQLLLYQDSCQLCTREQFAPLIREALDIKRGGNLSASSMEVLAVVAYNQPVTRAYIDTIRGVDSSYAVSSLLDKGLLESVGRLDAPGRPVLLGTTEKFLRVFGLKSLADLPETEALSAAEQNTVMEDAATSAADSGTACMQSCKDGQANEAIKTDVEEVVT